jgi:DNA-binding MarR family transcriptional regulator
VTADLTQLLDDLVRVETVLWNAVEARLRADHDLTLARFETMRVLDRSGPCRVLDVADTLAIGWSGASKIADRVEAAGHCRRRPNPRDARSSLISLTPRGRTLLRRAEAGVADELRQRLAPALSTSELDGLSRSLSRVRAALRAPARDPDQDEVRA